MFLVRFVVVLDDDIPEIICVARTATRAARAARRGGRCRRGSCARAARGRRGSRLAGVRCRTARVRGRGRRGSRGGVTIRYVIVIVRGLVVGVVLFGFLVVDDGVVADFGFVIYCVLGVDVGQLVAAVNVDVAIPSVVVDGDVGLLI
mgnify:FL=1